ncbi:testicular spindle-associated protein SHCBP1L-like [Sceloporus undulatus]|uniref:testicular spindle-associated protein SHCBP1L-like n=1 Tax=Sceloporus undulatus TaxID=8520 RepID=UPI001C4C1288|nr:testicular spindle-associated protein SHCBP1L-like [Sceloporus undulatus]
MASSAPQEEGGGGGGSPEGRRPPQMPRSRQEEEAQPLPPQFPSYLRTLSGREKVELYCDRLLQGCKAEDTHEAISKYLLEKMKMKEKWLGIWKTNPNLFLVTSEETPIPYLGVLVEVACKLPQNPSANLKLSVSIAEPFSSNIANIPRAFIDKVLKEMDHYVPLLEIYPVQGQDSAVSDIAKALEIVRYAFS